MMNWGKEFDESALEWKAVIPTEPGWFAITLNGWAYSEGEFPGYEMDRVIAWAWVKIVVTEDNTEYSWDALWGIIAHPPPNREPPPALADRDAFYVHESEITDEERARWQRCALREVARAKTRCAAQRAD